MTTKEREAFRTNRGRIVDCAFHLLSKGILDRNARKQLGRRGRCRKEEEDLEMVGRDVMLFQVVICIGEHTPQPSPRSESHVPHGFIT